jgi:hypothetical protein
VLPDTPEPGNVALIVVLPVASAVATPRVPAALLTEATAAAEDDQVTAAVRSCVVPLV